LPDVARDALGGQLVPSGVRTLISNCASSFLGKKPFGTFWTSGTIATSVINAAMTTTQR
jgi:hypothetical protein